MNKVVIESHAYNKAISWGLNRAQNPVCSWNSFRTPGGKEVETGRLQCERPRRVVDGRDYFSPVYYIGSLKWLNSR